MNVGIIGFGAISKLLLSILNDNNTHTYTQVSLLVRDGKQDETNAYMDAFRTVLAHNITVHTTIDDFISTAPDLAIECAGHNVVSDYVPTLLQNGISVIIASIGALADKALYDTLQQCAKRGKARLIFPAGALASTDILTTASLSGLEEVVYTGRKPPKAWKNTPVESQVDLDSLKEPVVFFEGSARQAAMSFPKNANVTAALALAGTGFDKTKVQLIADPHVVSNTHNYTVVSKAVNCTVDITGIVSPDNPKTSVITAFSLAQEALKFTG